MENQNKNRTWAQINLGNLRKNYKNISSHVKKLAPEVKILSVVKADAYGHGAVPTAKTLSQEGTDFFAVATVQEAAELREAEITQPILVLGYVDSEDIPLLIKYDVAAALCDSENAIIFSERAQQLGAEIRVHIALDTGMTRIGFDSSEDIESIKKIADAASLPGIKAEGIFTHFAISDEDGGDEFTQHQIIRFKETINALSGMGINFEYRHCANSGAILQHTESFTERMSDGTPLFNMVRAGIVLYGYYPDRTTKKTVELYPVMTVKAHVVQVRDTPEGVTVSYGRTYCTPMPSKLAVVTMGYADGYHRAASGQAKMVVNGKTVPVVGRICMDMCMLDVTGLDVKTGDIVTVFGEGDVTAATEADDAGTISYEILCAVSKRIPRFYTD